MEGQRDLYLTILKTPAGHRSNAEHPYYQPACEVPGDQVETYESHVVNRIQWKQLVWCCVV